MDVQVRNRMVFLVFSSEVRVVCNMEGVMGVVLRYMYFGEMEGVYVFSCLFRYYFANSVVSTREIHILMKKSMLRFLASMCIWCYLV